MTSQRAGCTLAFSVKTRSISGFIKTSQSLRWAWRGRGGGKTESYCRWRSVPIQLRGWPAEPHRAGPARAPAKHTATHLGDGRTRTERYEVNQSINGQSVIRGTVFICLHAAYPAICWLCSSALHAAGGFFFFMLPYCLQNCKTCLELRPFQLVTLHPKCQPLKPLQKKGRGATACVIKYFR